MRITYNDKLNKLLNPYLESLLKEKSSLEPGSAELPERLSVVKIAATPMWAQLM